MKAPLLILIVLSAAQIVVILSGLGAMNAQFIANGVYTLTVMAVLTSVVIAIAHRGRASGLWRGCAVFAAAYFVFAVLMSDLWPIAARLAGMRAEPVKLQLVTSYWLAWWYDQVGGHYAEIWTSGGTRAPALHLLTVSPGLIPKDMDLSMLEKFIRTGHCVFTWLAGVAGGVLGNWMCGRDEANDTYRRGL